MSGNQMTQEFVGSHLLKLELLHFYGSSTQWQTFQDMFRHAVHENPSLSNIERFYYLKNLVTGQASKAIIGIQATEQSYEDAIALLKERFGNQKIIEQQSLSNLQRLKAVKSSSDVVVLNIVEYLI